MAVINRGAWAVLEGRFAEAEECLRVTLESGTDVEDRIIGISRAVILREQQGRAEELLAGISSYAARYPRTTVWRVAATALRATLGHADEARAGLESIAGNDFADIPRDLLYIYCMVRLCDVVSFLGGARRAAILYDLVLPYADRCATSGNNIACLGSVSRPLGRLATLLARYEEAEQHFERALEMNARIRARIWVAHTRHDYARMLVARGGPGDRAKAATLAAQALATAREVGMKPLEAKVVALQTAAGLELELKPDVEPRATPASGARPTTTSASAVSRSQEPLPAVFQRDGDVWTIAFEDRCLRLKDAKGLQYIAHLLRHEGQELHAAELAAGADAAPVAAPGHEQAGDVARGLGGAGEVLDAQARSEYRRRLADLQAEAEEATRWGDVGRATKLREEIEFLTDELAAAAGLGGRVRKAGDVADRARKAVTSRIRETIARIAGEHPTLGRHLDNAIRTGLFCSYRPDRSPGWQV